MNCTGPTRTEMRTKTRRCEMSNVKAEQVVEKVVENLNMKESGVEAKTGMGSGLGGGAVAACSSADFALVQQVEIEAVDGQTVTYSTRATPVGGSKTADDQLRKTFVSPITEVWTAPIPGAPPPVAMVPGAIGNLYLS